MALYWSQREVQILTVLTGSRPRSRGPCLLLWALVYSPSLHSPPDTAASTPPRGWACSLHRVSSIFLDCLIWDPLKSPLAPQWVCTDVSLSPIAMLKMTTSHASFPSAPCQALLLTKDMMLFSYVSWWQFPLPNQCFCEGREFCLGFLFLFVLFAVLPAFSSGLGNCSLLGLR